MQTPKRCFSKHRHSYNKIHHLATSTTEMLLYLTMLLVALFLAEFFIKPETSSDVYKYHEIYKRKLLKADFVVVSAVMVPNY